MSKKSSRSRSNRTPLSKLPVGQGKVGSLFAGMPNVAFTSWYREIAPDYLWVLLILTGLERRNALSVLRSIVRLIDKGGVAVGERPLSHTDFGRLREAERKLVGKELTEASGAIRAISALRVLESLPEAEFWRGFCGVISDEECWFELERAMFNSIDHQSQVSTDCRWFIVSSQVAAGKLQLQTQEQLDQLGGFPDVGDLKSVRPMIRALEQTSRGRYPASWVRPFWEECLVRTPCSKLLSFASDLSCPDIGFTVEELRALHLEWKAAFRDAYKGCLDVAKPEAAFGLYGFALRICQELVQLGVANSIVGRLGLRTLVEAAIVLRYLVSEDNPEIWQKFRSYGTGKAKLSLLKGDEREWGVDRIVREQLLDVLANEDIWLEYVDIELGHWAKSDLRKIAKKCACSDIYDEYYDWCSHHSHAQWGAVRESVLVTCGNALHGLHRVPSEDWVSLPDLVPAAKRVFLHLQDSLLVAYPGCINPAE